MSAGERGLPEFTHLWGASGAPVTAGMVGCLGICFTVGRWCAPAPVPEPVPDRKPSVGGGGLAPWPQDDLYAQFACDYERLIAFRAWCASRKGKPGTKKKKRPVRARNVGPVRATHRRTAAGTTKVDTTGNAPPEVKDERVVNNYYMLPQQPAVNAKWLLVGVAIGALIFWAYSRKPKRKPRGSGRTRKGRR